MRLVSTSCEADAQRHGRMAFGSERHGRAAPMMAERDGVADAASEESAPGGEPNLVAADGPQEVRRHGPLGRLAGDQLGRHRRGDTRHAREPDHLEDQGLGHGARHARRAGRRPRSSPARTCIVRLQAPAVLRRDGRGRPLGQRPQLSGQGEAGHGAARNWTATTLERRLRRTARKTVEIAADGERRVDWRVNVPAKARPVIRMKALTDEESDAMEMSSPCYVHGMLKTESLQRRRSAADGDRGAVRRSTCPPSAAPSRRGSRSATRRRWPARWSTPCPTWSTTPTAAPSRRSIASCRRSITQKTLQTMGLDLAAIQQEADQPQRPGNRRRRPSAPKGGSASTAIRSSTRRKLARWSRRACNRLTEMQLSDGGWGWFSGCGEQSTPHTTAVVVHGLQVAQQNDVALVPGVLDRGVEWLEQLSSRSSSTASRTSTTPARSSRRRNPAKHARRQPRRARLHGARRRPSAE